MYLKQEYIINFCHKTSAASSIDQMEKQDVVPLFGDVVALGTLEGGLAG